MTIRPHEDNKRRCYETPRLRVVELVSEEVLGQGCKLHPGDTSGVQGNGCTNAACSIDSFGS